MPQSRQLATWKIFSLNVKRSTRWLKLYLEDKRTPGNRKGAIVSPRGERSANEKQNYIYCHILTLPEPSGKKKNGE